MNKGLKELIEKFESKKEFREVKLRTRQSFREDQAALNQRLSKYRPASKDKKEMSNGDKNGHVENGTESESRDGEESALESIVIELQQEKKHIYENYCFDSENDASYKMENDATVKSGDDSSDKSENTVNGEKSDVTEGVKEISVEIEKGINVCNETKQENNSRPETVPPEVCNGVGHETNSKPAVNGNAVNGNSVPRVDAKVTSEVKSNGEIRLHGTSSLITRPRISATRTAVTPEPNHKSLRGIYQKNPKLTPSSTDHLDNISLSSVRISGHSHVHETEPQRVAAVPPILSAEVRALPADGNVAEFSVEQMVTFFRLLCLPEELVYRLSKCKVDGKRFSVFSDKELTDLGMNNPIIRYFRDKTAQRPRRRVQKFML